MFIIKESLLLETDLLINFFRDYFLKVKYLESLRDLLF